MPRIEDQILASAGGLNYDDDARLFASGDTDYRLNVIPSALGGEYVLTNLKGTTTKSHSLVHAVAYAAAVYTSVGSCYDVKRNAIYYFVYSDLTNHSIIRYNIDDDDFDKIVWDNPNIGLTLTYPIVDSYMIDDWLYWNPRDTSPRSINVDWGYYNYNATAVIETDPATDWAVGDLCEFRSKIYTALEVVDTGTIPIGSNSFEFTGWSYGDINFSYRDRYFFNTVMNPREKIGVDFLDDTSVSYNKVRGKVFQFTYRVYTTDLGMSSSAPFTDVVADFDGETYDGDYTGDVTRNNRIRLIIPHVLLEDNATGRADWLFERYEILFREGGIGQWKLLRSLTHDEVYTETTENLFYVDFYNDGNYGTVDNATVEIPYNFLPITAKSQFSIDGERAAYGGVTEGYGSEYTNVSLTAGVEAVTPVVDLSTTTVDSYELAINPALTIYDDYGRPEQYGYESGAVSVVGVVNGDKIIVYIDGVRYEGVVVDQSSVTNYIDDLIDVINKSNYYATNQTTKIRMYTESNAVEVSIEVYHTFNLTDTYKLPTFKAGDHHPFCQFYYDHMGRMSNPIYTEDMRVYVPFLPEHHQHITAFADLGGAPNEVRITCASHGYATGDVVQIKNTTSYDGTYTITGQDGSNTFDIESAYTAEAVLTASAVTSVISTNYRNHVTWEIKHNPPDYAVQWGFGYAGRSSVGDFVQYNVYSVAVGTSEYASYVGLNITSLQDIRDNGNGNNDVSYPNSQIEPYVYEEGDRVRVITMKDTAAAAYDELSTDNWTEYTRDYEIKAFDTSGIIYIDVEITASTWVTAYNDNTVFIEVYKSVGESENLVFHEIGEKYGFVTTDGDKFHLGATQDQADYDGVTPAMGKIVAGDVYLITRAMSVTPGAFADNETLFLESASWSDFYESEMWGKGKALADFGIEQKSLNNIRYGNKLNPLTRSSGLGTFDALDYLPMSYSYGDIVAGRQVGDVLSILFANNVASILVGATQMFNDDGTSQVLKSDNILGSVNYSEDDYGCVNPESVLVVDRTLYFFDLTRKCYVRKAVNGMFAISDYKMKKYFIDKADELLASGTSNISVYSGWDDDRGLLYVGFNDSVDTDNCEYVLFHEASNRWVAFVDPRNYEETDLFTMPADDRTYDSDPPIVVVLSVATVASGTSFISTITVDSSNGSWNDTQSFTSTNTVSFVKGDVVSLSFQLTLDSQSLEGIVYLEATGTGDMPSLNIDMADYASSAYTQTVTITQASTFNFKITIDGNQQVDAPQTAAITWGITVTQKDTPLMVTTPSKLMSFVKENIHLHNDNTTRCNFFGVQKEYTARVYGVASPNIIKIFESIALHTNARFEVTDIQIPVSLNYPNGMQSKLPSGRFEKEEGVLRSDYLCNQKTNQATATIPDLVNGDNLRGYIIQQDLDGDETTEHTLYKIDILSQPSKY